MTELKPCPFCGRPAKLTVQGDHHGECFNLGCSDDKLGGCPGRLTYYTVPIEDRDDAVNEWNKRTLSYAHRNGETEAPTEPGSYWFDGSALSRYKGTPAVIKGITHVIGDDNEVEAWLPMWDDGFYEPVSAFTGRWWGPVVAPWENGQP